jgi:hypothetical protein
VELLVMSDQPWFDLFEQANRIFVGVGDLLRDTDRLLENRGFKSAHAYRSVGTEGSTHMDQPWVWMPAWFVRYYTHETAPSALIYVSVFLHDRGGKEDWATKARLYEPVVVAGVIRGSGPGLPKWNYWNCKNWFWSDGKADGEPVTATFEPKKSDDQTSNRSFGVKLDRIKSLADLDQDVITPLLALAEVGASGSTSA